MCIRDSMLGARDAGTSIPLRLLDLTEISKTSSPASERLFKRSILAPISISDLYNPSLVGFTKIFFTVRLESLHIKPATIG